MRIYIIFLLFLCGANILGSGKLEQYDRLFKNTRPIIGNKDWLENERIFLLEVTMEKNGVIKSHRLLSNFFINENDFLHSVPKERSYNQIPIQQFFNFGGISCTIVGEISDFGLEKYAKYNLCKGSWRFNGLVDLKVGSEIFSYKADAAKNNTIHSFESSKSMIIAPVKTIDGTRYSVKYAVFSKESYARFALKVYNKSITEERFEVFAPNEVSYGDFIDDDGFVFEIKEQNQDAALNCFNAELSGLKDKIRNELNKK